ncbi:hypothetical protein FGIG_04231 [Fasciola gigantica]|uniref:Otopetrin n=1 Tax=Fasciola gigantica TaxID=46835 RepID=A0A504X7Y3_FASGI|nr:hypothetical protein FGIG_04231 [Fasciola gigantica]
MKVTWKQHVSIHAPKTEPDDRHEDIKLSANSARKAKTHAQRVIAMLYCIVILAIGMSIVLYCTGARIAELEPVFVSFFTIMYVTSVVGLAYMLWYVVHNRHATIEAIERGDLSATRILFSMRGEPVSLYLRFAICIFAIMAIAFASCRAYEVSMRKSNYLLVSIYTASKISFFIVQTVFFLVLHRLVVLANVRMFSVILLHTLTVNLCVWVESAIEKVSLAMIVEHSAENIADDARGYTLTATHYFLPAIPEYCAIGVAVTYEMAQRIGQLKQIEAHHEKTEKHEKRPQLQTYVGLMLGSILSVLVLVIVLYLETAGHGIDYHRPIWHLTETILLFICALILSVAGIVTVRKLKFSVNFAKNSLDEKLLLVTFFLTVNFFVACCVLCVAYLTSGLLTEKEMYKMAAQLVNLIMELIQIMVQTYLIHDMFYRCCHHESYWKTRPGRGIIAILSAINFCLWMIYSFQTKHNDVLLTLSAKLYQKAEQRGLHMFIVVMLPMVMLFRYHSSVCLAVSFERVYEDEVTRYESMLRWIKQDTTKEFLHSQKLALEPRWDTELEMPSQISKADSQGPGTRPRASSHPALKCLSTIDREVSSLGEQSNQNSMEMFDRPDPEYNPQDTISSLYKEQGRRGTRINLEMARIRVAASEFEHRMTEQKLKQQKMREMKAAKSLSSELHKRFGHDRFNPAGDLAHSSSECALDKREHTGK